MPRRSASLWDSLDRAGGQAQRALWGSDTTIALSELPRVQALSEASERLRGKSVLVRTSEQLSAALALIAIDGIARRLVLCPPDLESAHLPYVVETAQVDAIVTDLPLNSFSSLGVDCIVGCDRTLATRSSVRASDFETEWILFTSGTTGVPKMVVHTLATLTDAIKSAGNLKGPIVWATFYDIRRYGGLQIFLRAVLGGGSLVLSEPSEPVATFLTRAKNHGATHMTGTPSHWRRALMTPVAPTLPLAYARLSGEIADQAVIDHLQSIVPQAKVAHAFASTEAGVAFEVTDGRAGFPASLLGPNDSAVQLDIEDGSLRIRSPRTARRYLGGTAPLLDPAGFVDTGDIVEKVGDRCHFVGRRGGIINVGGLKIHPEEVEAVINRHPRVRMSRVTARKNPITGAVVAAEVVLACPDESPLASDVVESTRADILATCRSALAAHKIPASIRVVASLDVTPSGKLGRRNG
jgi:acyl-coenzyme A synthetase/AMP-(fatty) acid ligase